MEPSPHPHDNMLVEHLAMQKGPVPMGLFLDVDDTLIVPGNETIRVASVELSRQARDEHYPIVAVTGRRPANTISYLEQQGLEPPDAVIGLVGTSIWIRNRDGSYTADERYDALMKARNYDRLRILAATYDILANADPSFGLVLQQPQAEADYMAHPSPDYLPYKIGLHFFASTTEQALRAAALFSNAFPQTKVLICEEIFHNRTLSKGEPKKYCLDVAAASKGDAVRYLAKAYSIEGGLIAGDSGNDIDMLIDAPPGFVSVLVGGHKPEARAALEERIGERTGSAFQKIDGRLVFIDTHPNRLAVQSITAAARYLRAGFAEHRELLTSLT